MSISIGKKKIFGLLESRYAALFGMFIILLFHPWSNTAVMSAGTWIIFFSAFFNLFQVISGKFSKRSSITLLFMLALSFLSVVASMKISYEALVSLFCFWEIPVFWGASTHEVNRAFKKHMYIVFLILSVYYIYLSFSSVSHKYIGPYGEVIHDALTLGYNNPNQTGMYLLVCFFVLLSATAFFEKKLIKQIFFIVAILELFVIWGTKSRTCIILAMIYLLYYLFFSKNTRIFLSSSFVQIIVFIPIIMFLFLMFFQQVYENFIVMGEAFDTGRFSIYTRVFRNYSIIDFLFGDFSRYRFDNLHNGYLSIMATVGVPSMVLFISLLYQKTTALLNYISQRHQRLAYIGLLFLIMHMAFEAAFFTAGSVYAVSVLILVWLSNETQESEDKDEDITYQRQRNREYRKNHL